MRASKPGLLEPIMKLEIECPEVYQGDVVGDVIRRRGLINPLIFVIRSATSKPKCHLLKHSDTPQTFAVCPRAKVLLPWELATYRRCPSNVQEEIVASRKKK